MADSFPRLLVIKSNDYKDEYLQYKEDGSVVLGEESVFSTLVKMELEQATVDERYIHLHFSYSSKYLQVKENDKLIVAVSNRPEEDISKESCTLFEPVIIDDDKGVFYLIHVQSGGRVMIDGPTKAVYVDKKAGGKQDHLGYVDWRSLVKLPEHVAFVGDNNKYLQVHSQEGHPYLQFSSDDANSVLSGNRARLMPDGHVRITSDDSGKFWRRSPNWIWPDYNPGDDESTTTINKDTLFWPVKYDYDTIALKNAGNNKYCKPLTSGGKVDCLNAAASTIGEAKLLVRELVTSRKIYNVRYQLDSARVYDEGERLLGSVTLVNEGDSEASMAVIIEYEDSKTYSFDRSTPLLAGVPTAVEAGLPLIEDDGSISVNLQIKEPLLWSELTYVTTPGTASGRVTVPARSSARVTYEGKQSLCDVPFYYTQLDQISVDDASTSRQTEQIDGIYHGINNFGFNFLLKKVSPL